MPREAGVFEQVAALVGVAQRRVQLDNHDARLREELWIVLKELLFRAFDVALQEADVLDGGQFEDVSNREYRYRPFRVPHRDEPGRPTARRPAAEGPPASSSLSAPRCAGPWASTC